MDIEPLMISTVISFFSFYLRLNVSALEFSHTSAPYIPHSAFVKHLGEKGRGSMVRVKVTETGVGCNGWKTPFS